MAKNSDIFVFHGQIFEQFCANDVLYETRTNMNQSGFLMLLVVVHSTEECLLLKLNLLYMPR